MKHSQIHITHDVIQEVLTNSRKLKSFHQFFFLTTAELNKTSVAEKKVEKFMSKQTLRNTFLNHHFMKEKVKGEFGINLKIDENEDTTY